jgi:hypothetical protein
MKARAVGRLRLMSNKSFNTDAQLGSALSARMQLCAGQVQR